MPRSARRSEGNFDNDGTFRVEQPLPPRFDFVFGTWAEEIKVASLCFGSGTMAPPGICSKPGRL